MTAPDPLLNLRVASPCPAKWEEMAGNERVRFCSLCQLSVYNFKEMTRREVERLLARGEGRVCARMYQRADGTLITRDCPRALRAVQQRTRRVAGALFAALLSLAGCASGRPFGASSRHVVPSKATIRGVMLDRTDQSPLPGVTVMISSPALQGVRTAVTDVEGAFVFDNVPIGAYTIRGSLDGKMPATRTIVLDSADQVADVQLWMFASGNTDIITVTTGAPVIAATPTTDTDRPPKRLPR